MDQVVSGAYVFTGERSARSYLLNKMGNTLSTPEQRAKFLADEAGYMRAMGCTEQQIDLVLRRDWRGMMDHGSSIYMLLKIGAALGVSLPEIGRHTSGDQQARKEH